MKVSNHSDFTLPQSLRGALISFRRRLWTIKMIEAVAATVIVVLIGFLFTFALDRLHDTSAGVRAAILAMTGASLLVIPYAVMRWVIRRRRFDQLARLLAETRPATGDPLLGVIELADDHSESERSRSPELVNAAIVQVADQVAGQDLTHAIPDPKHIRRGLIAAGLGLIAAALFLITSPAATNAWSRLVAPWKGIPRYTFAQIQPLPESMVVAQDEPFKLSVSLDESSRWNPTAASVELSSQPARSANLHDRRYDFDLPGQIASETLSINVGDFSGRMTIEPKSRAELSSLIAHVQLPSYLQRGETIRKEVRGSTLSVLKDSTAELTANASRPLATATINGQERSISVDQFVSDRMTIDRPTSLQLQWRDGDGLTGKEPLGLLIEPIDDSPPTVACDGLPRRKVLLDREVIKFRVLAADDYGVRRVGLQWRAIDEENPQVASGESIIGAGDPRAESLELVATFCASDLNIQSPSIAVRVFAEDYLDDRERSYSAESIFDILSADQHAIWITEQLSRWQRMSLDARDRELQLHETNKKLRQLTDQELRVPENQQRLTRQAELERSGGNQLASLARNGESLLAEAMRNPGIGVGHLDRWAEMIQTLNNIADHRMPSVAELLQKAANGSAAQSPSDPNRHAGQNHLAQPGSGQPKATDDDNQPKMPSVSDVESSQHDLAGEKSGEPSESKPGPSRLTLPNTMLASPAQKNQQPKPSDKSPQDEIADAVKEQQDLLAEFDKIADELNEVLANLEGSTIVKRLKAASRHQQQVASQLASIASDAFGVSDRKKQTNADSFGRLATAEWEGSERASDIMDDMDAYFQRSRLQAFRKVLDQMRDVDVTAELRLLGDELRKENGLSISQAEFWSDTFDRWAEDLVGACESGECPGGKSKGSLPPSVVLEVLKLLEGEVNLREQTRVAEQARPALSHAEHIAAADKLWNVQNDLQQRTDEVVDRIRQLPDADGDFAKEIGMLSDVSQIMVETIEILRRPDTGPSAIAAETEIIEKLLESKRFSPSGGGGGAAPGGGGKGETETPALALVGSGVNAKEMREEMQATQATGVSGRALPEEYRDGLDDYFNRLERWRSRRP